MIGLEGGEGGRMKQVSDTNMYEYKVMLWWAVARSGQCDIKLAKGMQCQP